MSAGLVILILKIAVSTVTLLWIGSMIALACGKTRLHGRINIAFFALTLTALIGLEVITNLISPGMISEFLGTRVVNIPILGSRAAKEMLKVHLGFSMPAAGLLFVMLFTGLKHKRTFHIAAGILFGVLWTGTFITGIFFLPHE